jgi:hypothetical protein
MGRKWNDINSLDYFMILEEIDFCNNKYEGFGMALYSGHKIEKRPRWFNEVWNEAKEDPGFFLIV